LPHESNYFTSSFGASASAGAASSLVASASAGAASSLGASAGAASSLVALLLELLLL